MTDHRTPAGAVRAGTAWTPWRVVIMFGVISLAADLVYEGARSVYGPLLASLGASAVLVGGVTGAGEAAALVLRLVFGPWADRSGRYWAMTTAGYALTVVSVPLMALTPFVGGAGLALAVVLILLERTGKAVRSPAKSALLAHAAQAVGRGRGFGVHKAMDQTGAFVGPLLVAAVVALTGALWAGLAVLAVPAVVALVVLVVTQRRVPDPSVLDADVRSEPREPGPAVRSDSPSPPARQGWLAQAAGAGLPAAFFWYAAAASLMTGGLVTFGIIGYHLVVSGLVGDAAVPVLYSVGMLAEAVAALVVGGLYDRSGPRVLLVVPVLVAVVPGLALAGRLGLVIVGIVVWGLAFGLQDSTIKALVADVVEPARRATAYGVFAAVQGVAAIGGGLLIGWLYERSSTGVVVAVALAQVVAIALLLQALRLAARQPSGQDLRP